MILEVCPHHASGAANGDVKGPRSRTRFDAQSLVVLSRCQRVQVDETVALDECSHARCRAASPLYEPRDQVPLFVWIIGNPRDEELRLPLLVKHEHLVCQIAMLERLRRACE